MDGHFVPNLTFGAKTIKHLRPRTELPFDAHLMISEPGRYIDEFLDAGCDSITIHVEIEEEIAPTLRQIRAAGRAAGLSLKPGTPLSALEPYRELLDIVMVMTVEPGFGGQKFMKDVAREKLLAARDLLSHKSFGGEVHVDGGINRETAEFAGGLGVDILVVGSALFIKGHDMGREIRLIRALADEGYQFTLNDGVPPIPRDKMVRFTSLPQHIADRFMAEIEAGGSPRRHAPRRGRDEPRRRSRLRPPRARERRGARGRAPRSRARRVRARGRDLARGVHPRARGDPAAQLPVRALLQRTTGARVRVDGEVVGEIGSGPRRSFSASVPTTPKRSPTIWRARPPSLRIFRDEAGRTNVSLLDVGGAVLVVSQFTLYADTRRGRRPGFTNAASPAQAERLYQHFADALRGAWRRR